MLRNGHTLQSVAYAEWLISIEKKKRNLVSDLWSKGFSGESLYISVTPISLVCPRCTFPQKLPAGVQEDPEPSLQSLCACLHPSLWQHLQHGCRGPHQYLLQALLLLHLGVQPHWSLWTGAPGEILVWPQMCQDEVRGSRRGSDKCFLMGELSVSLSWVSIWKKISAILSSITSLWCSMLDEVDFYLDVILFSSVSARAVQWNFLL